MYSNNNENKFVTSSESIIVQTTARAKSEVDKRTRRIIAVRTYRANL